ncbi:MAG: hypothetical protein FWH40_04225 [Coriobacteriia bacterium]|nr:hypothetical protein [Coriobacteriia bacterium]
MIIFTWTGKGWVLIVLPCAILCLGGFIGDALGLFPTYTLLYLLVGLILSALANWFVGSAMNKEKTVAYDQNTGVPITVKNQHTLFNIPAQYSAVILLALAILSLVVYLVS